MKKILWLCLLMLYAFPQALAAEEGINVSSLLGEAIEDINFQSFDMAEEKLNRVLKSEPTNPYAKYYMASLLSQTKRSQQAVPYLESIKSFRHLFPEYEHLLASVYLAANLPLKALPIYKKNFEASAFSPEAIFQYANALEQSGYLDSAIAHYRLLTHKSTPYTDAARFQIANILMQLGANSTAYHELGRIDVTAGYGASAKAYQESLKPALKPISIFLSGEYFYSTNPGSASSTYAKGAVPQAAAQGSAGQTIVAALSSMDWEANPHWKAKLSYTYFASFYNESFAKSNEFSAHFFAPTVTYTPSPIWQVEGKLDYQVFNLGEYNLSNNYGGTLTLRHTAQDRLSSAYISLNYIRKRHNQTFGAVGNSVNMQYLDANSPTLGTGAYWVYSESNSMLSIDYSLLYERTLTNTNALLNEKAQDSVYREHTLTINHQQPFTGAYNDFSLDVSLGYSYRNYLNPQSGTSLPSIQPGNYFTVETQNASSKLQYRLGTTYNLNFVLGADWANASSQATELSYQQTRYFSQISGNY